MTLRLAMEKVDHIVQFCAKECERQKTTPLAVANMFAAYTYALDVYDAVEWPAIPELTERHILHIAKLVEPVVNHHGYRTTPVRFANFNFAMNAASVPRAMSLLVEHGMNDSGSFVKEFLDIHPFGDGNGRTAAILFNMVVGDLHYPQPLPDFYGEDKFHQEADCYA